MQINVLLGSYSFASRPQRVDRVSPRRECSVWFGARAHLQRTDAILRRVASAAAKVARGGGGPIVMTA